MRNGAGVPPPSNVADFDIEGFKLGMNEADVSALLQEKCDRGEFNISEQRARDYDIAHSKIFSCYFKDTQDRMDITLTDKVITVSGERIIVYPEKSSDADKGAMRKTVYDKLLEKYGKPVHEGPQDRHPWEIAFLSNSSKADQVACWGDCTIKNPEFADSSYYYDIAAGQDLFAAAFVAALQPEFMLISRVIADIPAITATDEAFEKAVAAAQAQEQEAVKQQSQQAAENVKF